MRVPRRAGLLAAAAFVVVLLVAGVLSTFASRSPDGLERVAQDQGFADSGREAPTAGPLDGYQVDGVDGALGRGLAGVAGVGLVLVLAGGLTWALRRRDEQPQADAVQPAERRDGR